jgi:hypothetical protein
LGRFPRRILFGSVETIRLLSKTLAFATNGVAKVNPDAQMDDFMNALRFIVLPRLHRDDTCRD